MCVCAYTFNKGQCLCRFNLFAFLGSFLSLHPVAEVRLPASDDSLSERLKGEPPLQPSDPPPTIVSREPASWVLFPSHWDAYFGLCVCAFFPLKTDINQPLGATSQGSSENHLECQSCEQRTRVNSPKSLRSELVGPWEKDRGVKGVCCAP